MYGDEREFRYRVAELFEEVIGKEEAEIRRFRDWVIREHPVPSPWWMSALVWELLAHEGGHPEGKVTPEELRRYDHYEPMWKADAIYWAARSFNPYPQDDPRREARRARYDRAVDSALDLAQEQTSLDDNLAWLIAAALRLALATEDTYRPSPARIESLRGLVRRLDTTNCLPGMEHVALAVRHLQNILLYWDRRPEEAANGLLIENRDTTVENIR